MLFSILCYLYLYLISFDLLLSDLWIYPLIYASLYSSNRSIDRSIMIKSRWCKGDQKMIDISLFNYNSPDLYGSCAYARDALYGIAVSQGHIGNYEFVVVFVVDTFHHIWMFMGISGCLNSVFESVTAYETLKANCF